MYKNLKELRKYYNLTQAEFANSISIPTSTYNQYENGTREPGSDFWIAVSQKYRVSIDYLMGFTDNPKGTKFADTFQISPEEKRLIIAWRNCDKRAREDVEHALRNYLKLPESPKI